MYISYVSLPVISCDRKARPGLPSGLVDSLAHQLAQIGGKMAAEVVGITPRHTEVQRKERDRTMSSCGSLIGARNYPRMPPGFPDLAKVRTHCPWTNHLQEEWD